MAESDFMRWFVAQHGERERRREPSDEGLAMLIRQGEEARLTLRARQEWDARKQSALYAWQVAHPTTQEQE